MPRSPSGSQRDARSVAQGMQVATAPLSMRTPLGPSAVVTTARPHAARPPSPRRSSRPCRRRRLGAGHPFPAHECTQCFRAELRDECFHRHGPVRHVGQSVPAVSRKRNGCGRRRFGVRYGERRRLKGDGISLAGCHAVERCHGRKYLRQAADGVVSFLSKEKISAASRTLPPTNTAYRPRSST